MKVSDIEVALVHHIGDDLDVVNAARVSFDKESDWATDKEGWYVTTNPSLTDPDAIDEPQKTLKNEDKRLINYLAKHKHHSPFNHSFLSFRIKAPIFVARQLVKHKFMPWNEVSRRYVDSEPEFYFPDYWRKRAENVKQGSSDYSVEDSDMWIGASKEHVKNCLSWYTSAIDSGICAEQARMVLPQNTMTEWRWSGTLGAFLDMLVLRLDPHTQKETRDVAELIAKEVKQLFPVSYAAYLGE